MTEEIEVYHQDMETFLKPQEYQAFLKARQEVEEYHKKALHYELQKSIDEEGRDECQRRSDRAKSDYERLTWDIERTKCMMQTMKPVPHKPKHSFNKHDRYIRPSKKKETEAP